MQRAREEYEADSDSFATNYTRQDAAILNVLRACEQSIDLANHVIKTNKMGIPNSSADSFELLHQHKIIGADLLPNLRKMVHFRNLVVHQYQQLDLAIFEAVIVSGLNDLILLGDRILTFVKRHEH